MKNVSLAVAVRKGTGKGVARQVRMIGDIPAVFYGPETEPISLVIKSTDFRAAMKEVAGTNPIFNMELDGKTRKVIVREIQRDPVTSKVKHIDFFEMSKTKPIHLSIPIHFIGMPEGVKTDGGIQQTNMRELEITCLPDQIPEFVEVDVSELGIGDSIHVSDLSVENVNVLSESRRTIVVISAPTVVVEEKTDEVEEEVEEGAVAPDADSDAEAPKEEKTEEKEDKK